MPEKRVTISVRLKEITVDRLGLEAEDRDLGRGLIVEKGLALLFDKWDHPQEVEA